MKSKKIKYSLRVSEETYEKIRVIADKNSRSINNQIDLILKSFLESYEGVKKISG